jgi:hypothetical protein
LFHAAKVHIYFEKTNFLAFFFAFYLHFSFKTFKNIPNSLFLAARKAKTLNPKLKKKT